MTEPAQAKTPRAAAGMGSLLKLPTGHWRARIRIHGRPESKTSETKALANEWLKLMRHRKISRRPGERQFPSLG